MGEAGAEAFAGAMWLPLSSAAALAAASRASTPSSEVRERKDRIVERPGRDCSACCCGLVCDVGWLSTGSDPVPEALHATHVMGSLVTGRVALELCQRALSLQQMHSATALVVVDSACIVDAPDSA